MKILVYPDPFLNKKTTLVKVFNKSIQKPVRKMFNMMYKENGVGLAANQIGLPHRILVINLTKMTSDEIVLINPKITKTSGKICEEEGCLSVPGLVAEVKRFTKVTCRTYNMKGQKIEAVFEGLLARVVQHEIDHLNGILFIDRLDEAKKKTLLKQYGKENS